FLRYAAGRRALHPFPTRRSSDLIAATAVMLVAFLAGVPIAIVAITGAAWTLFTRRVNPEKVYREINWALLVLFAGLFVVTAGLRSEEHTSELQSPDHLVCRLLLE